MKLSAAFGLLTDMRLAVQFALGPTLREIYHKPSLLLSPAALSRIFFTHVWVLFGPGTDEGGRPVKQRLITPNAHGTVLEIGAGHGHTVDYLDRTRVTRYVAIEPNTRMHPHIRERARGAGYTEADGSLVLLACGAADTRAIAAALGGAQRADTLIAVLTLCTIPAPESTLAALVRDTLAPGGVLLFYEHVLSPRADVAWWQRFWSPLWCLLLDGCVLDRPTHVWIEQMQEANANGVVSSVWGEGEVWGKDGEPDEHLFWHRVGKFVKKV